MATALQRQLAALATPTSSLLIPERKISSILFTPQEAARHKREVFYQIGLEGLDELIQIDPTMFQKFQFCELFNEASKNYERIVEDKEANDNLDPLIEEFLLSISPYMMLKASLKCFEWLINRFHIEKFNVEAIMETIMPYYDTKVFSLIIGVLEIRKNDKTWEWIVPNVKTSLPISKPDLFARCQPYFVIWMFSTLKKYIKIHKQKPDNLRPFVSFITSVLSGSLTRINQNLQTHMKKAQAKENSKAQAYVRCVWSLLSKLCKSLKDVPELKMNDEIHSMIYIVSTMLFNVTKGRPQLSKGLQEFTRKVMTSILKNHPRPLKTQAYLLLNILSSDPQNQIILTKKLYLRRVLNEISIISSDWDLWYLSSKLILQHCCKEEFEFSPTQLWETVKSMEYSIPQRSEILRSIYDLLQSREASKRLQKWKKAFLTKFEREYPTEFDLACKEDSEFASGLVKATKGKNLILLSQHPDIETRKEAVKKLLRKFRLRYVDLEPEAEANSPVAVSSKKRKNKNPTVTIKKKPLKATKKLKIVKPDTNRTAEVLLPRFKDESFEIVHLLIKQNIQLLLKIFSANSLTEQLISIVQGEKCNKKCLKSGLTQLCNIAEQLEASDTDKQTVSKIFVALVPYLFPTKESALILSNAIFSTSFGKKNSFFRQYYELSKSRQLTVDSICDFSYDTVSRGSSLQLEALKRNWSVDFSNEISTVFTMLTYKSIDQLIAFIDSLEKLNCEAHSSLSYPITRDNFSSCIRLASKKQTLSLELVLTTIFNLTVRLEFEQINKVLRFVFKKCEKLENRNVCVQFMGPFLKKAFVTEREQFRFWVFALVNEFKNEDGSDGLPTEFIVIRCMQCLYFFLKDCVDLLDRTGNDLYRAEKPGGFVEVILTQCLNNQCYSLRNWGVKCLEVYIELERAKYNDFIKHILEFREEILADQDQIALITCKAIQQEVFKSTRDYFIQLIVDRSIDEIIIIGLLNMFRFANSDVFNKFFPLATALLDSDPDSKKLLAILDCFDGSLDKLSFEILVEALKHKQSCTTVLSKITPDTFDSYDDATKKKLIALFIDVVLNSKVPEIKIIIQRRIRKWVLDANLIALELDKCVAMEKILTANVNGAASANRKEGKKTVERKSVFGDVHWTTRTEVVLEFVQTKKRLRQKSKMILPCFKLLKICIALEEQAPVEYLKQLILTTLTLCCYEDGTQTKDDSSSKDWIHFNVETVIDCLRCSRNPQTHHHALILLNYAAKKFPEQVLHGIMSLFTFMGNSILRQDDSYSTQLIQQTVTTIIPTLANTKSVRQFSKNLVSAGIFRVFTSAVQDIPVHRRLPVFISLVETLDPADTMWQVCVIIVDNALTRNKKRSHLNADLELATELVWNFDPTAVLSTLDKVYTYLISLPIYERNLTPDVFKSIAASQDVHSKSVIDLGRKETLRDVEIVVLFTIELVGKICTKFSEIENKNDFMYDSLLEKCLALSRLVSSNPGDKILRHIGQRNFDVIEKINIALEPKDFVLATIAILAKDDVAVKRKILDLLNQRILNQVDWFKDLKVLLDLIPHLVKLGTSNPESEEQVTLVQTTFLSLKLVSKHLVLSYPDNFIAVFELALNQVKHKNRLLRASALLCLGELFCLKSLILPNLGSVCSAIIRAFKASVKLNTSPNEISVNNNEESEEPEDKLVHDWETSVATANLLCISTMACLNKLIDQLGLFLGTSFLQRMLLTIFCIDGVFGEGLKSETRKKVFDQRLKVILKTFGAKIPLRNSFVTIKEVFQKLEEMEDVNLKSKSLLLLIGLFKETLLSTSKADLTTLLPGLCDAFLDQFLLHREKSLNEESADSISSVENTEESILDCLVTGMVLKMSEGSFRPFYHKMYDWARDSLPRLITFYKLSGMAAIRLKSLFVTFAGFVINEASKQLDQDLTLTQSILLYFYQIFLHDREGFISIDRFNTLVKPLVDLIESEFVLSGQITIKLLNDTLIQLAVASNDLNRWQHMIDLLSSKTRHVNPQVRLNVISTIEAAATELGKDFLPLLPPAVPFLAEVLNDDDERVEKETRKMLLKLEELLGEPLQPYFTV